MIELNNVTKKFDDYTALNSINLKLEQGNIYGLVGTNGSGKSTMLRLIAGVYKSNLGSVTLDGEGIFDNFKAKSRIFFVSDDLYFHPQATLDNMAAFYKNAYPRWNNERYLKLCDAFPIGRKKRLSTFSKGMRRQAAFILALSSSPDFLLLDEAFDGLDPVIRHAVRQLISDIISESNLTVVISSHNLRELEDFCDKVCLLHNGSFVLNSSMDSVHLGFSKIQVAFKPMPKVIALDGIKILSQNTKGSVATIVCACGEEKAMEEIQKLSPIFCESISLTLEELFIYEMEAVGYDYSNIIF
ncbi:MAG: ABC transporter ATP-binding protein [Oscillospiraceae bacterium]